MGTRRGLSLIELLMAIFILGIGVISIAALFPAGIVQQRQSADDVIGPIVANNAMEMIRNRVAASDFGDPIQFGAVDPPFDDFGWSRPAFFTDETDLGGGFGGGGPVVPAGSISIFYGANADDVAGVPPLANTTDCEIPFNTDKYPPGTTTPPTIVFTPGERSYPMYSQDAPPEPGLDGQYHWECMFRRFQGRVLVAVFVYRVTPEPGDIDPYTVAPNPSAPNLPPLPIWLTLNDFWDAPAAAGSLDDSVVVGTTPCDDYSVFDASMSWQEPRQWILDQYNNTHRVLNHECIGGDPMRVELKRAIEPIDFNLAPYYYSSPFPPNPAPNAFDDIVSDIWYVPIVDGDGRKLTPVYVVVEEL